MIAALYVDPKGPYFVRSDVDPWDESRDAKNYDGPHRVIAHPPCGPWGLTKGLCYLQDASCAPRAVEQVRKWGGILEHPKYSKLWGHCGLPKPGDPPDACGGFSVLVDQCAWGHCCRKWTLLYCVGIDPGLVSRGILTGGEPTHIICSGPGKTGRIASKRARRITPPAFAEWLISLVTHAG